jgi:hypothetical protein
MSGTAEQSARTRRELLSTYGDRILGAGHFPGGFGRVQDGVWTPLG